MPQGRWSLSTDIGVCSVYTSWRDSFTSLAQGTRDYDRAEKKKGMVAHPRVLTQRTPVLRSGVILSLLRALLGRLFRSGFLLGAAFLCSCHIVHLLSLNFTSYTRCCSVATLVY